MSSYNYHYGDQIKADESGGTCGTQAEAE